MIRCGRSYGGEIDTDDEEDDDVARTKRLLK